MKKILIFSAVVLLACCATQMKPRPGETTQAAPSTQGQAAPAPTLEGDTFTGTIVGYRMGGNMARPYVRAKITGEYGQVVEFNLRKTTAVTAPAGNTIGFLKRFKSGRRVETKFTVTNGLNEAVAWHY